MSLSATQTEALNSNSPAASPTAESPSSSSPVSDSDLPSPTAESAPVATPALAPVPEHTTLSLEHLKLSSFPRDEFRQWILDEISIAERYIQSLRTHTNAVSEIHKLPNDLLSDIFNLVVEDDHQADRQVYMNLRLSAVCRRWREVALDSQLLWTVVDLSHLVRATAFLERSGTALVDAYLDGGFYGQGSGNPSRVDGFGLWETLSPHAHHISALYIEVPYPQMQGLLESLDCMFSNLINLRLLCPIEKGETCDIQPIHYNPSRLHAVKELDLYKIFIPWNSPAYNNLRDLDLRYQVSNPSSAPTMDQFLNVLERSPELEYLRLAFAGPMLDPSFTSYPSFQRKVTLSSLKSVTLYNNPLDIGHLLAHLDIPSTTCINLHAVLSPTNTICDLFPRGFSLPVVYDISTLSLGYTKTYTECAWEDLSLHLEASSKESPRSRINIDFKWGEEGGIGAWAVRISQTFRSLPILFSRSPITHLEITCSYHAFTLSDWRQVLGTFPSLLSLTAQPLSPAYYVPSVNIEDLLEDLTPPLEAGSEVICPELRRLKLGSFTMGSAFSSTLMDCVSARKSRDAGLCWMSLGHFNWVGEDEFCMPMIGESVGCRCGEEKLCQDPVKEWVSVGP